MCGFVVRLVLPNDRIVKRGLLVGFDLCSWVELCGTVLKVYVVGCKSVGGKYIYRYRDEV